MIKFEALYQTLYDDLKDSEMMLNYAEDICEENPEDKNLANAFIQNAEQRLKHFEEFHGYLVDEIETLGKDDGVFSALWHKSHEHLQEQYDCITKKVGNYN